MMGDDAPQRNRIAERIREARKLAGLSQGQVAKLMDLHRPTISEIEAGNRHVRSEELSLFAELFDVSVSWLLGKGVDTLDENDPKVQLAARELRKLAPKDLDRLLTLLAVMREGHAAEGAGTAESPGRHSRPRQ
jgi:transcriptional regulator with XRE-family HTH domain